MFFSEPSNWIRMTSRSRLLLLYHLSISIDDASTKSQKHKLFASLIVASVVVLWENREANQYRLLCYLQYLSCGVRTTQLIPIIICFRAALQLVPIITSTRTHLIIRQYSKTAADCQIVCNDGGVK